jgi:hypothetical protein
MGVMGNYHDNQSALPYDLAGISWEKVMGVMTKNRWEISWIAKYFMATWSWASWEIIMDYHGRWSWAS